MITWLLEEDVFSDGHARLKEAIADAGHKTMSWDDSWVVNNEFPSIDEHNVVFHGSLGNAAKIASEGIWRPGSFCSVGDFHCSAWFDKAKKWLLQDQFLFTTVSELVEDPEKYINQIGESQSCFVRPDSPLKPFSGRVLSLENISLRALDHGFYYDDEDLPILVANLKTVQQEWRFVVCKSTVVAGSEYLPDGRVEGEPIYGGSQWEYAQQIADEISPPDPVYVLDVALSDGQLYLVELNPFSGADMYNCDRRKIVSAIDQQFA